jgi:DNA repair protein RadD
MSICLYKHQDDSKNIIYDQWFNQLIKNVLYVAPTGSGKTVLFSSVLKDHTGVGLAIAHRQELVSQIALALAKNEIYHRIIAPDNVIKFIQHEQYLELGKSFYNPSAKIAVAGVNTVLARKESLKEFLLLVTKWVMDESHHILRNNMWGKVVALMPNAIGLGVTATPCRADGNGLGRYNEGVFDSLVEGPSMRDLIDTGYLCDYRIFAPPSDLNIEQVTSSAATGDFNTVSLRHAVEDSHLVGDVVDHYLRIAPGKLGITFATDVATAIQINKQFQVKGVKSEVLTSKTDNRLRADIIRRFRNRDIHQLVNVDLFGEGFDLPAVEVVSMARPTQSYGLYVQQFGRALRVMEGKDRAIIIDHASNVLRHGLPDKKRAWSLESRERRPRSIDPDDDIPIRYCVQCTQPYTRLLKVCPNCGWTHEPEGRSTPEQVDGDLFELDEATLFVMRNEITRIDSPPPAMHNADSIVQNSVAKNHRLRQESQNILRNTISWWAGYKKHEGKSDSEIYRLFYFHFKVDILSAQGLGATEADKLNSLLIEDINNDVI